jgi:anti-sigma B factor antagonist
MNVQVEKRDGTTIVHLCGDLNLATSAPVRADLVNLLNDLTEKRIVIDMSEVRFLDSMGLAILVEALKISRDKHIELVLAGVHGNVEGVLTLSRLDKIFNIVEEPA